MSIYTKATIKAMLLYDGVINYHGFSKLQISEMLELSREIIREMQEEIKKFENMINKKEGSSNAMD